MAKRRKRKRRAKKTSTAKPSASWLDHTRRLPGTLAEILKLTPAQFEEGVADLLQRLGYRSVQRVGGSGDLGVDITCQDKEGRSVVVQCKQYAGVRIGSKDIQTFIGMQSVHHRADCGMFVTTSEFTTPARNLAKRHGITLIDDNELLNLIRQAYRGQKTTPDDDDAATDTGREKGVIVRRPSPHLTRGLESHEVLLSEERSKANQHTMTVLRGEYAGIGDLRKKFVKLISKALENYANRPHDPERVVVNEITNDIFTGRRSDVKRWLQVALDDLHWEHHVVLFVSQSSREAAFRVGIVLLTQPESVEWRGIRRPVPDSEQEARKSLLSLLGSSNIPRLIRSEVKKAVEAAAAEWMDNPQQPHKISLRDYSQHNMGITVPTAGRTTLVERPARARWQEVRLPNGETLGQVRARAEQQDAAEYGRLVSLTSREDYTGYIEWCIAAHQYSSQYVLVLEKDDGSKVSEDITLYAKVEYPEQRDGGEHNIHAGHITMHHKPIEMRGMRVPELEVCTEWTRSHEGVKSNTLLVWLVEAPAVEHNPQSGAISFDKL